MEGLERIAIIGMTGRFPRSRDLDAFWRNLRDGVEGVSFSEPWDGASMEHRGPYRVPARGLLEDIEQFDPAFFGMPPRIAALMDPQHRLFLESAVEALEVAGYDPETFPGSIGVFAGASRNSYFLSNLATHPEILRDMGGHQIATLNDVGFLATRVSYKLNLRGPSLNVQTTCSTSLVAVHLACQSLLNGECDLALAGGVSVAMPQTSGYVYQEGGIFSADGHCRAFDARASGTVPGSGLGIVVLKRLSEALEDGDTIRAVILGSAVNNDGARKIGYTAPGIEGQADVIGEALAVAGVEPDSISYVEAHGTGTALGDPIEITALTRAFRAKTDRRSFCAVGSVKSNIGHLDEAAGVSGLIKTVLMLENRQIAPSLHFERPNPEIDFENSPFYVSTRLADWPAGDEPRRAGLSSFGLGGTNAHVILEEAPPADPPAPAPAGQLLVLSARSAAALESATDRLADFLSREEGPVLADVAYTLQRGRQAFEHRRCLVCDDAVGAARALRERDPVRLLDGVHRAERTRVAFVFPGQGAQAAGMTRGLYDSEPAFRERVDHYAELLLPALGLDLRPLLYPAAGEEEQAGRALDQTALAQPALFVVELALAELWREWGIEPWAMLGHSLGEYVAACLAGVLSPEDALSLVAVRGRMMQDLPTGGMLAVPLAESEVWSRLEDGLSLAAVNGRSRCVVSGPAAGIERLAGRLAGEGVTCRRLRTSHAFHSPALEPILRPFAERVAQLRLAPPRIPYLSNVTGTWIRPEEATDPAYWARHLRATVRFGDGVETLLAEPGALLLEVGPPGRVVTLPAEERQRLVSTLGGARRPEEERPALLTAVGRLWLAGAAVDWERLHGPGRRRVPLPTYSFARERCWIDPAEVGETAQGAREPVPAPAVPLPEPAPAPVAAKAVAGAAAGADGRERVLRRVQEILARLFGIAAADLDIHTSFLELGADSLLLLQAKEAVQRELGVPLSFYQLLEDCNTLAALAEYLHGQIPEMALEPEPALAPAPVPTVASPVAAAPAGGAEERAGAPALERIVAQQIELNNLLLQVLRQGNPAAPQVASAAPLPPPPAALPFVSQSPPARTPARAAASFPFDPVNDGGAQQQLSSRQRQHLEELVARYTQRTRESKRRTELHRSHFADNRASVGFRLAWKELVYPIIAERSRGSRFWDVDGNEYVDLTMGFGVNLFGHSPDFIRQAVTDQLERGVQIGPQSDLAGEVAGLLSEVAGVARVTFCNSGTEAVMTAMRLARAVTGRSRIALFSGSYHGSYDGTLFNAVESAGGPSARPRAPGVPASMGTDLLLLDYATPRSLQLIEEHGRELAAVLVEPVQSRRPDLQPREYLHELRRLTGRIGAALIFDETITGFRPHPRGARGCFDIDSDLVTYGKVVGGGMPIGVVSGSPTFMDAIDGGAWRFGDASAPEVPKTFFAGTFCKHPLSMAASRAVLRRMLEQGEDLQRGLSRRAGDLAAELDGIFAAEGVPIRVVRFGSQFMLSFAEPRYSDLFFYHLIDQGVYVWEGRTCFLSTAHADEDLDRILRAVRGSLARLRAGGFLEEARPERSSAAAAVAAPEPAISPLTESQRQVWVEAQIGEDASRAYNESLTLEIRGRFEVDAMREVLRRIVERHEALRTTFTAEGEGQQITPCSAEIDFADFSRAGEKREEDLARWRRAQEQDRFDLVAGPLFRVGVARLAADLHLLVFTVHHLVVDASSLGLILEEAGALYSARVSGRSHELPPAARFADYAARRVAGALGAEVGGREEARAFWQSQLAPPLPVLELPTDAPRPPVRTYGGGRVSTRMDGSLLASLKSLSAARRSTLFTVFLATFTVLLHRLTGQDDVVAGLSASDPNTSGDEPLVGFCINLLPLRSRIAPDLDFGSHLETVRKVFLQAHQHQGFPVFSLLRELALPVDWSRPPLVAAELNMERALPAAGALLPGFSGLEVSALEPATCSAKFDLEVDLVESRTGLEMGCIYNSGLFHATTVQRWLHHYETLLRGVVESPGARVLDLPLLDAAERHQLLVGWNDTGRRWEGPSFLERFAAWCTERPEAVAASAPGERLTYGALGRRVAGLARRLARLGVGPEVGVALLAERGLGYLTTVLAVHQAGGAFLPLDPHHPEARLAQVLTLGRVPLVLCAAELRHRLEGAIASLPEPVRPRVLTLTDPWPEEAAPARPPRRPANALSYILFTSGSTGTPKGALVEDAGMLNHLAAKVEELGLTDADVVAQNASQSFDISVWQLLAALLVGGRVHVVPDEVAHDPGLLMVEVEREQVSILEVVPSLLAALLDEVDGAPAGGDPRALRWLIATGEPLPPELARRWLARSPGVPLLNAYGPTECSDDVTHHCMEGGGAPLSRVPIGRPLANFRLYVLDGGLGPQPVGVAGEIAVAGIGVGRGYLDDPERTATVFVPDPWSATGPGTRLYRTGDLGRWLPDGRLEHLGRLDHQVKVRGFRIELGEIEAILGAHPALRLAAVVLTPAGHLAAYVVPRDERGVAVDRLRRFLEERLPEYMVPTSFTVLAEMPVGPTGKIDRRALPAPPVIGGPRPGEAAAPRNPVQQLLADLWHEVLGQAPPGLDADFFAAGGDSLLATRLLSRARRAFAVDLPLRSLFEGPSIRQLALQVERGMERAGGADRGPSRPPLLPRPDRHEAPLSFAQQRLWFLDRLEPGSAQYNIPVALRLAGRLDIVALARSFGEITRRHEGLRTTFHEVHGEPVQRIGPPVSGLPSVDLSGLPASRSAAEARRLTREESRRPFDLARGPLLRTTLLRLGSEEHVLLVDMHHIVSDGWSMEVLVRECAALYELHAAGTGAPLPALPVQYGDYAAWQREWLDGEVLAAEVAWWRERLAGTSPVLDLHTDRPRPAVRSSRGAARGAVLTAPWPALRALGRQSSVSTFMLLTAAFQALLFRYTGQSDFCFGTPVAGRGQLETEGLIGFFVNTLVLRASVTAGLTFAELLQRVREVVLEAHLHQDLPFERLVEELEPQRDLGRPPVFQVMFQVDRASGGPRELPGLSLHTLPVEVHSAKFDLNVAALEEEERLTSVFTYSTDLFDAATVERMLGHWTALLSQVTAATRIEELTILTGPERHQLLVEAPPAASLPVTATLHELFERVVGSRPDAVAVVDGDEQWTYAELGQRAGHLARRLRRLGVGTETPVALCLERSADLVAAIAGTLAAGGAYVPLDPAYPKARLAFLLADTGAPVLVTRRELLTRLPEHGAEILLLEDLPDEPASPVAPSLPASVAGPENAAYVIYTSGSTGTPKGVVVTHASAVRLFAATDPWFHFGERDIWTLFHSHAFDFSVWELWGALLYGGRLVIVPYLTSRSPWELADLLQRERVTVLNQTPSAFRQLLAETSALAGADLALRWIVFGGEALDPAGLASWFEHHGDERPVLVNMYGITETTVHVTWRPLSRRDLAGRARSPVGTAIPDLRLRLLDRAGQPVPLGVRGEIHVGGAGLARGYLGRPDLTAERFVPDPWSGEEEPPGARLYRAGDLACRLAGGELDYLGRADQQVKIRGFRIEPAEIEAALVAHPAVATAAVVVREEGGDDRRLVAYVVPADSSLIPSAAELRAFLSERLPAHMVPAACVALPALPLTVHGKLDRALLPEPGLAEPAVELPAGSRNPVEEMLAQIWGEAFGHRRFGPRDDFFALGGHSLLAVRMLSRVREVFQIDLPLRDVFELPTLAGLTTKIEAAAQAGEGLELPPLVPVPREREIPLSFGQQRLWFMDRLDPGAPTYDIPVAVRLEGALDPGALERAFSEILRRHEVLRTVFADSPQGGVQRVLPPRPWRLPVIDLEALDPLRREAEASRLGRMYARWRFDLTRGPLLAAALVRWGSAAHSLLVTVHHIASDARSMEILVHEVRALYRAFRRGLGSPLPEPAVQYADFAHWQRSWLQGSALEAQLAYWRRQLAGAPPLLTFTPSRPRPPIQTFSGARLEGEIGAEVWQPVVELARAEQVTPFMALLAAFQLVLRRHSGVLDLVVGTPVDCRRFAGLEELIGFFVNTLVLRTGLAGNPTFRQLLERVRGVALQAFTHQDLPFERLVEELRPVRDPGYNPLFQVGFTYGREVRRELEDASGLRLLPLAIESETVQFELNLTAIDTLHGLATSWQFNTDLYDRALVQTMAEDLGRVLRYVADDPDTDIDLLDARLAEEHRREAVSRENERKRQQGRSLGQTRRRSVAAGRD